jgi:hypothetical protein
MSQKAYASQDGEVRSISEGIVYTNGLTGCIATLGYFQLPGSPILAMSHSNNERYRDVMAKWREFHRSHSELTKEVRSRFIVARIRPDYYIPNDDSPLIIPPLEGEISESLGLDRMYLSALKDSKKLEGWKFQVRLYHMINGLLTQFTGATVQVVDYGSISTFTGNLDDLTWATNIDNGSLEFPE